MKKVEFGLFLVCLLFFATFSAGGFPFCAAQVGTQVGGVIDSDATWTKSNSPYVLTADLGVREGVTLRIEAGTTVVLGTHSIQVRGILSAVGTVNEPIFFNGTYQSRFPVVFSSDNSPFITFLSGTASGNKVDHANIVSTSIWTQNTFSSTIITNNSFSGDNAHETIRVDGDSPTISSNIFLNGAVTGSGSPIIYNNTFTSLSYTGERFVGAEAISITGPGWIVGNVVENRGLGINAYGGSGMLISDNVVSGCITGIQASRRRHNNREKLGVTQH